MYVTSTVSIKWAQTSVVGKNSAATTTTSGNATGMATSTAITDQAAEPELFAGCIKVGLESIAVNFQVPCH